MHVDDWHGNDDAAERRAVQLAEEAVDDGDAVELVAVDCTRWESRGFPSEAVAAGGVGVAADAHLRT